MAHSSTRPWSVFLIFLRLGLTSFGGPIAHLGYFRDEFVTRRRWLSERSYAELVALCQFLPGPASSQVGIALGLSRAGYGGAVAAWVGFTLPSAIALILFALGLAHYGAAMPAGALHGLKVVAVAVVAQAVWGMARNLCRGVARVTLMLIAACVVLLEPSAWAQVGVIAAAGVGGLLLFKPPTNTEPDTLPIPISRRTGALWLGLFLLLLVGLPILADGWPSPTLTLVDAFYRTGSLVFGGGHVVLPLLRDAVVAPGWVSEGAFLAGYGAAQAVPGPLFTFAAYLGAVSTMPPGGVAGAVVALLAIFLPGVLLLLGVWPFWQRLRGRAAAQAAMQGANAAVVGLLGAALYDPVWTGAVRVPLDFAVVATCFVLLVAWRTSPLPVVAFAALAGIGLGMTRFE